MRLGSLELRFIVATRMQSLALIAAIALASTAELLLKPPSLLYAETRLCTLVPSSTLAVLRVEQDTTLRFVPPAFEPMSLSGVRAGPGDSLLTTPDTPMPAARVRLLQLDSSTRAMLASHGVTDSQPVAFILAAPYRADCRTIRWTDSLPFVERGEVGYVRATLTPREQWIDGVPVLVIRDVWNYPYPRRRGLAFSASPTAPLAPAQAIFSLNAVLEIARSVSGDARIGADNARRTRALAWASGNSAAAELEPARTLVRRAVLEPDWQVTERVPSRLRGTYRVDIEMGGERSTWFFRTHDRPGYPWRGPDSLQTTAELIRSPYISGYRLVGYAAGSPDSLFAPDPRGRLRPPLVWLSTNDRPTTPGNDARRALSGILEFTMAAAPELVWDDLEAFVPRRTARDSALLARLNRPIPRGEKQPQLPLSVQFDGRGGVRADTTLSIGGRSLRVVLQRIDTLSIKRPY